MPRVSDVFLKSYKPNDNLTQDLIADLRDAREELAELQKEHDQTWVELQDANAALAKRLSAIEAAAREACEQFAELKAQVEGIGGTYGWARDNAWKALDALRAALLAGRDVADDDADCIAKLKAEGICLPEECSHLKRLSAIESAARPFAQAKVRLVSMTTDATPAWVEVEVPAAAVAKLRDALGEEG